MPNIPLNASRELSRLVASTGVTALARKSRDEIFDPFLTLDEYGRSEYERNEAWRAQCWAYYLNGGGGDPWYFDYEGYLKMHRHER